ncbi:MAG: tetratricopeptide repeat protein [Saprospiraceae bacterium]|nr:tetratricopeptide repeat protein [Saprospiraceae bacterium]
MDTLLQDSLEHFRHKMLKKALVAAQIALDFARKEGSAADVFRTCLLLARIFSTNARYALNPLYYQKALDFLQEAEGLHWAPSKENKVDLLINKARVLGYQHHMEAAYACLGDAEKIVQSSGFSDSRLTIRYFLTKGSLAYEEGKLGVASEICWKALELFQANFEKEKEKELLAELYSLFANVLLRKNDFFQALEYGQALLALSRGLEDVEKEIHALMVMAIVSSSRNNYKIAMQYFQDALMKSEAIGYQQSIADCLINMATIYAHLYNYDDALLRYEEVMRQYEDLLDKKALVTIFNNVGNIHASRERFEKAKPYFEKALSLSNEAHLQGEKALALAQTGKVYTGLGELEKATNYTRAAAELLDAIGSVNGKQINLLNQAVIFLKKESLDLAKAKAEEGIAVAESMGDEASQIKGYQILADILEKMGALSEAYHQLKKLAEKQEAFTRTQLNRQFLDLEIKNALREKQLEIEQLTKENEYQSLLLDKSDQIKRQNDELVQMNEDLKQFAYVASHDLKEPLRMIGSYAQIITRMYEDKLDEKAKTYFGYITEGVTRMNKLLDALLKYTTVGKSDEEFEWLELQYIVDICKVHLKVLIEESEARITYDDNLPEVYSARSLLILLIQNLLSNAIKFRKPDTKPKVHISAHTVNGMVEVRVSDNGIGIAPENLGRIFEIFQRLHARSQYEGTGIGLAICHRIVQRLGGNIRVESIEGEGSTFIFTLPKKSHE